MYYQSSGVSPTKYHKLDGLNPTETYYLTILEAEYKIELLAGTCFFQRL